ncbi:unnamed protein product [Durusdinium trenchii]|uniref:Uncharacterized protein n=1 Tax=Durusdinium trenchii TaxID=1381693 RepID=A0ABP0I019_9DINO
MPGLGDLVARDFFTGISPGIRPSRTSFEEAPALPASAVGQIGPAPPPVPDARAAAAARPDVQTPPEPPPPEANEDILAGPEAVSSQASTQTIPGGPRRPSGTGGGVDHFGSVNTFFMAFSAILIALGLGYDHCMDAWSKYSGGAAPKDRAPRDRRGSARSQGREIGSAGDEGSEDASGS